MEFRLHLNFIRECMRKDKIGSKFRFLIFEKIRNKMAHVFALCFTDQYTCDGSGGGRKVIKICLFR